MYKLLIERSVTIVYFDNGNDEFNVEDIAGVLANDSETIELVNNMPNEKYYINFNGQIVSLNFDQALFAYNKIIEQDKKEYEAAMRKAKR